MLDALVAGVLAGYAIALPVGAIAALLITLGAQHGARVAAGGALGAATVDGLYATVAVTAGAVIAPLIATVEEPLRWISVAVLVGSAADALLPRLTKRVRELRIGNGLKEGMEMGPVISAAAKRRNVARNRRNHR